MAEGEVQFRRAEPADIDALLRLGFAGSQRVLMTKRLRRLAE